MRIVYNISTLSIIALEADDQSITSFGSEYSAIQSEPENALKVAIAIGLDANAVLQFMEQNNLMFNMTPELIKVLKDRAFGQKVLNEFLSENKNMDLTLAQDMAMLNAFYPIRSMLEIGAINRALEIWTNVAVDSIITQQRKDKYYTMLTDYLNAV